MYANCDISPNNTTRFFQFSVFIIAKMAKMTDGNYEIGDDIQSD